MKPWEETWTETEPGNEVVSGQSTEVFLSSRSGRLRLATAAPEMARLLINLGCDYTSPGPHHKSWLMCHYCESEVVKEDGSGHMDDCELVAVLRKAGVLSGE